MRSRATPRYCFASQDNNQKRRLDFAGHQFVLLCAVFPLALTLTEAKSPRMWDTPFLFMVGNAIVIGVYLL